MLGGAARGCKLRRWGGARQGSLYRRRADEIAAVKAVSTRAPTTLTQLNGDGAADLCRPSAIASSQGSAPTCRVDRRDNNRLRIQPMAAAPGKSASAASTRARARSPPAIGSAWPWKRAASSTVATALPSTRARLQQSYPLAFEVTLCLLHRRSPRDDAGGGTPGPPLLLLRRASSSAASAPDVGSAVVTPVGRTPPSSIARRARNPRAAHGARRHQGDIDPYSSRRLRA